MLVYGTVAEYNPFHLGHAWHLAETRRILDEPSACIAVMSGNYVQRGQPAFFSAHARAEMALRNGADLVIELPLTACLSSAEGFARGGLAALDALGLAEVFSFGSEWGRTQDLLHTAQQLQAPDFSERIRAEMTAGISYAAARQQALKKIDSAAADRLSSPNDILGVEYCRAILAQNSKLRPVTVPRIGTGHDAAHPDAGFASASFLRTCLPYEPERCQPYMPSSAYEIMRRELAAGRGPYHPDKLSLLLLSHGRRLTPQQLGELPDASEGLENRLWDALYHSTTLSQAIENARSRRYPESRIRRMLMCAFLGITRELAALPPSYLRVLAFNDTGRTLLKQAKKTAALPLLIRPSDARSFTGHAAQQVALDVLAQDLFALLGEHPQAGGRYFQQSPVYVRNSGI